jgi:hypothetical protein
MGYPGDVTTGDDNMKTRIYITAVLLASHLAVAGGRPGSRVDAGEPDPGTYWSVRDVRPGMKGIGRTVMLGTKLEDFEAEVLGVLRDVTPGHDLILCRLKGCNLEHAGIIQGMSGSPIYVEGKLLGAVSYSWEFAKDPIAGITPFEQMVAFCRSNDRRLALREDTDLQGNFPALSARSRTTLWIGDLGQPESDLVPNERQEVLRGMFAGMRPIMIPLSARGFSERSLSMLGPDLARLGMTPLASGAVKGDPKGNGGDASGPPHSSPLTMAPIVGGFAPEPVVREEEKAPLVPGSPLMVPLIIGDFDLSGAGTVTHVEGKRVYGFGHPMFNLGACSFPMMTGYVHVVYPRSNVSMKLTSPLKVVGVIDTDVSTAVAGRLDLSPDMLPVVVSTKVGRYSDRKTYHVRMVREPRLLPKLVRAVLFNSIDCEGNLPDDLKGWVKATIRVRGRNPVVVNTMVSHLRQIGMIGDLVEKIARTPFGNVRIESIDCDIELEGASPVAEIASVRLASSRLEPGGTLKCSVRLQIVGSLPEVVEVSVPLPENLPEGRYQAVVCGAVESIRRSFEDSPHLMRPRDLDAWLQALQVQAEHKSNAIYLMVRLPEAGLVVEGQALPQLPGSARAVLSSLGGESTPVLRSSLIMAAATFWVIEGTSTVSFTVLKDQGFSIQKP